MSITNTVLTQLRDWSLKSNPVTLSCALCGELPCQMSTHYCVSVEIKEIIDVIIIHDNHDIPLQEDIIKNVIKEWKTNKIIGKVFIICTNEVQYKNENDGEYTIIKISAKNLPCEAYVHEYEKIAEHYILVGNESVQNINIDPHNFFSCNLLPLLLQNRSQKQLITNIENKIHNYLTKKGISGEMNIFPSNYGYGNSKKNCKSILKFYSDFIKHEDLCKSSYRYAAQQWLYAKRKGVITVEQELITVGDRLCE